MEISPRATCLNQRKTISYSRNSGRREVVGRETNAAVWTSLDGTTWTRLPVDSPEGSTFNDFGGQAIRALLVVDDVFVALGREGRGGDDDGDIWLGRPAG